MDLVEGAQRPTTTIDYDIQAKYDEFNARYFDGKLPKIPVEFAKLKGKTGLVRYTFNRTGKPRSSFEIRRGVPPRLHVNQDSVRLQLSSMYDMPEVRLDSTLLHEMIHVYFLAQNNAEEVHGDAFMAMLRKLSRESGIRLTVKDDVEGLNFRETPTFKAVGVFIVFDKSKTTFVLLSPNVARADGEAIRNTWQNRHNFDKAALYIIASEKWSAMAERYPVKRKINALYYLKDDEALRDLETNGRLQWEINPKKVGA